MLTINNPVAITLRLRKWETCLFATQLILIIPISVVLLKIYGYRQTLSLYRLLTLSKKANNYSNHQITSLIQQYKYLVRKLRRSKLLPGNCLSRSISIWWLLKQKGILTKLYIGIRREQEVFKAHAWLEFDGKPFNAGKKIRQRYSTFNEDIIASSLNITQFN